MNLIIEILLILIMTATGAFGAMFLKKVNSNNEKFNVITILKSPYLYIGGLIYVSGAIINMYLLNFIDYSILYPITSLSFVWTLLVSHVFLSEKITKGKICSIALILIGVIVLSI